MRELGYVEGENLAIEWRSADGMLERLPALAAEMARLKVDVIVVAGTLATSAAQKATATIPIVFGAVSDPVASGFVNSLARPGGNITGLSNILSDISPKHFELLLEISPGLSRVAVLANPANASHAAIQKSVQAAAQSAKVKALFVEARTAQEIESAFVTIARESAGAVIVVLDPFFNQQRRQIAELAAKNRLASINAYQDFAQAGGLMSYGENLAESFRRAAAYVDRILKGAKPGDLPVEQPMKLELVINGKTAKALGITIPQSVLLRADRVID
jgi:putative ABC transport system substrate-binding protein